jgi:hypothetical protein
MVVMTATGPRVLPVKAAMSQQVAAVMMFAMQV